PRTPLSGQDSDKKTPVASGVTGVFFCMNCATMAHSLSRHVSRRGLRLLSEALPGATNST
ncbi:hypothetical protein OFN20_31610, partial [Escherichia coli]|nr:hypothetical protein [Escherichia coli]